MPYKDRAAGLKAMSEYGRLRREQDPERAHLYDAWKGMRKRCSSRSHRQFSYYGGRGISVCSRWNSFEAFIADMGPRPTSLHTIDRINNDGNYEPSNCRWATRAEQNVNRRNSRLANLDGEIVTLKEACARKGLRYDTVLWRVRQGKWSMERALNVPVTGSERRSAHAR